MTESLYHKEYFSYTKEANEIYKNFEEAIKPMMKEYFEMGYSIREIAAIAHDAVSMTEAFLCMDYSCKLLKKKRNKG